jgi:threonine/homoserine/homoserine lactone efflux protein
MYKALTAFVAASLSLIYSPSPVATLEMASSDISTAKAAFLVAFYVAIIERNSS